mmetsp:Transcript_24314/g.50707  ORF Transcript_24314/g.50707 Transcript_24314/m.50707 type:complete len:392 (+) Transcript_24314:365-1540(+)
MESMQKTLKGSETPKLSKASESFSFPTSDSSQCFLRAATAADFSPADVVEPISATKFANSPSFSLSSSTSCMISPGVMTIEESAGVFMKAAFPTVQSPIPSLGVENSLSSCFFSTSTSTVGAMVTFLAGVKAGNISVTTTSPPFSLMERHSASNCTVSVSLSNSKSSLIIFFSLAPLSSLTAPSPRIPRSNPLPSFLASEFPSEDVMKSSKQQITASISHPEELSINPNAFLPLTELSAFTTLATNFATIFLSLKSSGPRLKWREKRAGIEVVLMEATAHCIVSLLMAFTSCCCLSSVKPAISPSLTSFNLPCRSALQHNPSRACREPASTPLKCWLLKTCIREARATETKEVQTSSQAVRPTSKDFERRSRFVSREEKNESYTGLKAGSR